VKDAAWARGQRKKRQPQRGRDMSVCLNLFARALGKKREGKGQVETRSRRPCGTGENSCLAKKGTGTASRADEVETARDRMGKGGGMEARKKRGGEKRPAKETIHDKDGKGSRKQRGSGT